MTPLNNLLEKNKKWADAITQEDPDFFSKLAKQQKPKYLWVGCSDSRVPATQIVDLEPGEIFVHRNIANQVIHTDLNCLSVIQYAVEVLKVEHIIVCGHYGCGGVKAAMGNQSIGLIDNWIRHIKDVYKIHKEELDKIEDEDKRWDKFVELNVVEQVFDLAETSIVQNAWKNNQNLTVHGWAYGIGTGIVNDLNVNLSSNEELDEVYQLKF